MIAGAAGVRRGLLLVLVVGVACSNEDAVAYGGGAGCGTPAQTGVSTQTMRVLGEERTFVLVLPESYDGETALPLVFAYHGRGGDAMLARTYFGIEEAAGDDAVFVYPDGLPRADMNDDTGWDLARTGADVEMFDAIYESIRMSLCIDTDRVYATGHSFGGYMSNSLACYRSETLRAIGEVAGGPPFGQCGDGRVAAWMAHGMRDEVVPFSQGEAARDVMLERNACADTSMPVEPAPCVAYDGCTAGADVVWCAHDEPDLDGHAWPTWAGAAIWRFFTALAPEA